MEVRFSYRCNGIKTAAFVEYVAIPTVDHGTMKPPVNTLRGQFPDITQRGRWSTLPWKLQRIMEVTSSLEYVHIMTQESLLQVEFPLNPNFRPVLGDWWTTYMHLRPIWYQYNVQFWTLHSLRNFTVHLKFLKIWPRDYTTSSF